MGNEIDFEELEKKTSRKFVDEIQSHLVDYEGNDIPIKSVLVEHTKHENIGIDFVKVLMISDSFCHSFTFSNRDHYIQHNKMFLTDVDALYKMFDQYYKAKVVEKAPAVTEANQEKVIKEFETVIKNNNLNFRNSTSAFRWARWNVFKDAFPTNEATKSQLEEFKSMNHKFLTNSEIQGLSNLEIAKKIYCHLDSESLSFEDFFEIGRHLGSIAANVKG